MTNSDNGSTRIASSGAISKALGLGGVALLITTCSGQRTLITPSSVAGQSAHGSHSEVAAAVPNYNAADDKGYIDGWFNGETVQLYYTKSFFCSEPPDSAAATHCELGADPQVAPRAGPIPTIYAIAWTGGPPPPEFNLATFACPPGSTCLNHPSMIDVSRIRPPGADPVGPGLPHSHIVTERRAGWFKTVNIRVSNLAVWNEIAVAKSLAKVRELQANPELVANRYISQDTSTNIYFFIASWRQ